MSNTKENSNESTIHFAKFLQEQTCQVKYLKKQIKEENG